MEIKKQYITRQRKLILGFLEEHPEELFSAEDLMLILRQQGENIGLSTIYRNLDKMVSQDILARIIPSNGSGAKYEYLDKGESADCHYHMVCEECGQTLHVNCGQLARLASHMASDHNFILDRRRTVLYGRCGDCAKPADEPKR